MKLMIFENYILQEPLVNHIESMFYYKGFKPDHSIERVVPTGHLFIIFELNGFTYHTFDRKTLEPNGTFKKAWVSGVHKNYLSISAHQDSEMLVVQFKINGSFPFLNYPVHELNNKVVGASEIFGEQIIKIRKQIIDKNTPLEKFKCVENWLISIFDSSKTPSPELVDIFLELQKAPISDHNSIIKTYPNTQKHLINQFKKYFGLTPKVFHRIFRFNEILKKIQNQENLEWTQIAYEFGYSDQSHFIKEFKEFSGFNPQEYIDSDYHKDEPNFFPLDRKG